MPESVSVGQYYAAKRNIPTANILHLNDPIWRLQAGRVPGFRAPAGLRLTGAGDTVMATLSLAISAGASYRDAMELATEAATIAIGTMGTAIVKLSQLETAVNAAVQPIIGAVR